MNPWGQAVVHRADFRAARHLVIFAWTFRPNQHTQETVNMYAMISITKTGDIVATALAPDPLPV